MSLREWYHSLYGLHAGETCVIIGNGPGLADIPLDFLRTYDSFGCNLIIKKLPEFCPTYYSALGANMLVRPEQRAAIAPIFEDERLRWAFVNRLLAHKFPPNPKILTLLSSGLYGDHENSRRFSLDPLDIIGVYATQTYIALQLAYAFGYSRVLIVGLDGTYAGHGKMHDYDEDPLFESGPSRYGTDENWRDACELVYAASRRVFEADGREILNVSTRTVIQSFKQGDWRDFARS